MIINKSLDSLDTLSFSMNARKNCGYRFLMPQKYWRSLSTESRACCISVLNSFYLYLFTKNNTPLTCIANTHCCF